MLLRFASFFRLAFATALLGLAAGLAGCSKEAARPTAGAKSGTIPPHPSFSSSDCRDCHADVYKAWSGSHHALAHRPVEAAADADAFAPGRQVTVNDIAYELEWKDGKPAFLERRGGQVTDRYTAEFVLGHTPLRQYVVPAGDGRYQAAELTFDPAKKEWFNVFGDERRQPGEWGHWRGRGMNWNSMCAHCHMTDYRKNYDPVRDSYATTWKEHGIGCAQCHGHMPGDHVAVQQQKKAAGGASTPAPATNVDWKRAQETCAPCHARNELLTGELKSGASYHDHFRLTLPTDAAVFYPDGQVRDEDFNYTSLLTSRMGGKAGVTCLDCHDPHSGATRLPVHNNALCLQCHGPSPRNNAPVIDPVAHSRHAIGSKGYLCVSCHMPTTTYMQRDPRHDHGFIKPDPLLTKELGIPNACNGCHTDQSVDWAIQHTDQWYGAKMESRQRQRTRVVAAAQAGQPDAADRLLQLIASEDVPAWKATLLLLTRNYAPGQPRVVEAARAATGDADPLVRSAAAQVLAAVPAELPRLRPLLNDATRLVRLDAAWPLSAELPPDSPARRELDAYLAVSADQPAGRMRIGQDLFNRGRAAEAEAHLRKAAARNPRHDRAWYNLGLLLAQTGRRPEALAALQQAEQLAPQVADYPYARATVHWQLNDRNAALAAARRALEIDPNHGPARGLLQQSGR